MRVFFCREAFGFGHDLPISVQGQLASSQIAGGHRGFFSPDLETRAVLFHFLKSIDKTTTWQTSG